MIQLLIGLIIAYLIGSVSSAMIVCKIAKQANPQEEGSGNPGATNVLRIAGKKLALWTLLGDALKGIIAILIGRMLGLHDFMLGLIAIAVVVGHIYPLFYKFKGGKGVATMLGAMLALSPELGLLAILTWAVIAGIFRYSSLAALVSAVLAPIYALIFVNPTYFVPLILITLLLIWRHLDNIDRLMKGKESKIVLKKKE